MKCRRGGDGPRDKFGHCLCDACKLFRAEYRKRVSRKEYHQQWRRKNKDKVKAYSKKWIANNRLRRREIEQNWKARNQDRVKRYNQKSGRKWSQNNAGKRNAIYAKRRAALLLRLVKWADIKKIQEFYAEAKRLTIITGIRHEVDHIFPLQGKTVSGLHVHNNLQILTMTENRSKGIKCAV